jgi:hemerythrin
VQSPLLHWRLRESCDRRLALARNVFSFDWRDDYSVGIQELDSHHRGLFEAIDELARRLEAGGGGAIEALDELKARAARHYEAEELYMARWSYPGLDAHARAHAELLAQMDGFKSRLDDFDPGDSSELIAFMKDCLLRHTLLVDRLYMPFIKRGP